MVDNVHSPDFVRAALIALLLTGCHKQTQPPKTGGAADINATANNTPAPAQEAPEKKPTSRPWNQVQLTVIDRTSAGERPAELVIGALEKTLAAQAKKAGYTVARRGNFLGIEVFYAVSADGKMAPKAAKGILMWAASATLTVRDADGLSETFEATWKQESPFVRATIPDLDAGLRQLLAEATGIALREVTGDYAYREATLSQALDGLKSEVREEIWAALRRIGELGDTSATPEVMLALELNDPTTTMVAVGVLGRLRDPRAIKALVKVADNPNAAPAILAVDALVAIGTAEAWRYIKAIGASHAAESVRDAVRLHQEQRDSK